MSDRIIVDPPTSDTRRERVERQLFAQLANVRVTDRADAAVPVPRRSRSWMGGMFAVAAAAAVVTLLITRSNEPSQVAADQTPSRVVTPAGGTSQFSVGDSVIVAGSDTSVEVKRADDGGTTLVVARGSVDCDVLPRNGRPPFRVIAGDIAVEVVGTRFTVTRTPNPRVDVARGKVRVTAPGGTWLVAAGESWTPQVAHTAETDVVELEPVALAPIAQAPVPAPITPTPAVHVVSAHAAYQAAVKLESSDPAKAAKAYRTIANGKDAFAPLALYSLVELLEKTDPDGALRACDEYARRFPSDTNREEITWLRVDILKTAGRRDEARAAAAEYLRQFPKGTYAGTAARIAPQ